MGYADQAAAAERANAAVEREADVVVPEELEHLRSAILKHRMERPEDFFLKGSPNAIPVIRAIEILLKAVLELRSP